MNLSDLNAILDVAPSATREVALPNGKTATVTGIPFADYLQIVRRFPHLLSMYLAPVEFAKENVGRDLDADDAEKELGKRIATNLLDADASAQEAADTAFIAAGLGHAHNDEAEKVVASFPVEIRDALQDAIEELTYGGDQAGFFGKVLRALVGRTMRRALAAAS